MLNKIKQIFNKELINVKLLPMIQILILVNIVVFILQCIFPQVTEAGVFRSNVLYSYISGCFLHGSIQHLAGNMLFISFIAPPIEKNYGSIFLLLSYIITGIAGSALFALYLPTHQALGASGSICGLMMLWIFHNLIKRRPLLILPALFYFMAQGINSGLGLVQGTNIGYLAHYGAALGAFFLLPIMLIKRNK